MDGQEHGQQGCSSDRAPVACDCGKRQADPSDGRFPARLKYKTCKLHRLKDDGKSKTCETVSQSDYSNSVRVTFNIPDDAATRLRLLAESADPSLRKLGITSVQFDGDQVISLTLSSSSSPSAPDTAHRVLDKLSSSSSSPPPPNRSANSIPCDRISTSSATSQSSLACESARKRSLSPVHDPGRAGVGPPAAGHATSSPAKAASPHRRHRDEGNSVCTVNAAQYLTPREQQAGSSQSYPPPSPSGQQRHVIDHCAGVAGVMTLATASSPSHRFPAAIPAASSASAAVPVSSNSTELSVAIDSECNTKLAEKSADAIRVTDSAVADLIDERIRSPSSGKVLSFEESEAVNRIKDEEREHLMDMTVRETADGSVMNCSEIAKGENEEDEEKMGSPLPFSKSVTASSESPSPDQDSSLRSSTSPSSTTTTGRAHPCHGQESPADSPSHEMQLLCNTSAIRQSSLSNDSPLQNTSPSHHSDSGIASSASQQEADPQPVLRQEIDCNNSADEHNWDEDRHADDDGAKNSTNSSSSHDEASVSSESSWRTSPPLPSSSHQASVFKFSTNVSSPLTADPVVQTSPIVAHKESLVVAVNGTSHSKGSDDEESSGSATSPSRTSITAPDAIYASRPDQPDMTPDLCFNDGETRPLDAAVPPDPPPASVTRPILSVASGDHNYIVISERPAVGDSGQDVVNEVRQNHSRSRNNSSGRLPDDTSLPNKRIDQNHSDLSTRPNKRRKCSSSTSSENIQTIGLEVPDSRSNNNNNSSSSSRSVDQRSTVCASGSSVDTPPIRNSCKIPIMNGHTYEV